MKSIINQLNGHAIMAMFPILLIWKKKKSRMFFLLASLIVMLSGCFNHFFRSGTINGIDAATIQKLQSGEKYFILHAGNKVMAMENLKVGKDKLEADLSMLPADHLHYLKPKVDKPNVVKAKDKLVTLMEVHMYYEGNIDSLHSNFSAPLSKFNRIDVYEFDAKTTNFNHVMSVVGIVAGAAALTLVVGLIIALATCNCPQVYVDNGGNYDFVSGVYSGSIYASMERTDYLPLQAISPNDELKMKIDNVKNEEQYINQLQLMQINHRPGINVLVDRHGNVHTYKKPQAPLTAIINSSTDIKKTIAEKDNESYSFSSEKNENGFSSTVLRFKKPADAKKGKLILHGGNSLWSGYIYHRFAEMFGDKYETWRTQKDRSNPEEMEQWQKDQSLPLMVYVEKNGSWELADYFAHTGNTATRDMIMEIDLSNTNAEEVKIKLETAYQFWNIDYGGMDFSIDEPTEVLFIDAASVIKSGNIDQKSLVINKDSSYSRLVKDESLHLAFSLPARKIGKETCWFLSSTGYYHNVQKYTGAPDLQTLNSFKIKGSFDAYSRTQCSRINQVMAKQ